MFSRRHYYFVIFLLTGIPSVYGEDSFFDRFIETRKFYVRAPATVSKAERIEKYRQFIDDFHSHPEVYRAEIDLIHMLDEKHNLEKVEIYRKLLMLYSEETELGQRIRLLFLRFQTHKWADKEVSDLAAAEKMARSLKDFAELTNNRNLYLQSVYNLIQLLKCQERRVEALEIGIAVLNETYRWKRSSQPAVRKPRPYKGKLMIGMFSHDSFTFNSSVNDAIYRHLELVVFLVKHCNTDAELKPIEKWDNPAVVIINGKNDLGSEIVAARKRIEDNKKPAKMIPFYLQFY